jgi:conjugal transfer pilin signal peptidase TrbI
LQKDAPTVLVAEAVVAGSTPDLTETVRVDVERRMGAIPDARR